MPLLKQGWPSMAAINKNERKEMNVDQRVAELLKEAGYETDRATQLVAQAKELVKSNWDVSETELSRSQLLNRKCLAMTFDKAKQT